jgi:hypothetical protein
MTTAVQQVYKLNDSTGMERLEAVLSPSPAAGSPITSGALPTQVLSSGVGAQLSTTRSVSAYGVATSDNTANASAITVELSPDGVTYSTVQSLSVSVAANTAGAVTTPLTVAVPQAWFVRVTVTHGTLGTFTYA